MCLSNSTQKFFKAHFSHEIHYHTKYFIECLAPLKLTAKYPLTSRGKRVQLIWWVFKDNLSYISGTLQIQAIIFLLLWWLVQLATTQVYVELTKRPGFDSIHHQERLISNEKLMKFPPRFQYKQVCHFLSAVHIEVK